MLFRSPGRPSLAKTRHQHFSLQGTAIVWYDVCMNVRYTVNTVRVILELIFVILPIGIGMRVVGDPGKWPELVVILVMLALVGAGAIVTVVRKAAPL